MKKTLIVGISILAIGFVSCKANRTCSCTSTSDGPGGQTITELPDTTLVNVTRKEIKDFCKSKNDSYTAGLETITISCVY